MPPHIFQSATSLVHVGSWFFALLATIRFLDRRQNLTLVAQATSEKSILVVGVVGVMLDPSMTYFYLRIIGKQSTDLTVVFVFPWLSLVVLRSSVEPSGWLEKLELELCPKEKVRNSVPPPLGIWRKEWNHIYQIQYSSQDVRYQTRRQTTNLSIEEWISWEESPERSLRRSLWWQLFVGRIRSGH